MKTMTCRELGGACAIEFHGNTFEEMEEMSKKHGMEMFHKSDKTHLKAMKRIQESMNSPESMKKWFDEKRQEFNNLAAN